MQTFIMTRACPVGYVDSCGKSTGLRHSPHFRIETKGEAPGVWDLPGGEPSSFDAEKEGRQLAHVLMGSLPVSTLAALVQDLTDGLPK